MGIARHYALVEQQAFQDTAANWATFFEEDLVLSSRYLEILATLISFVDAEPRVVQVSATGDTILTKDMRTDALYPMWHAWGFALRRDHFRERTTIVNKYLETIADLPYFMRDEEDVRSALVGFGLYPIASSQDYIKQEIRRHFGRLAVTTARSYGRYIGKDGEHFTPRIFAELGYEYSQDVADGPPTFTQDISAALADLCRNDQRAWAIEFDAVIKSRIESTHAQADVRASNAESRVADAEARLAEAQELVVEALSTESELRDRLSHLQAVYEDAIRQIEKVTASHSWRSTAGFRVLGGLTRTISEKLRRTRASRF